MEPESEREFPSLAWIHRVREAEYERTRHLPIESWLKARDPEEVGQACRRLGLRVRITARPPERAAHSKG